MPANRKTTGENLALRVGCQCFASTLMLVLPHCDRSLHAQSAILRHLLQIVLLYRFSVFVFTVCFGGGGGVKMGGEIQDRWAKRSFQKGGNMAFARGGSRGGSLQGGNTVGHVLFVEPMRNRNCFLPGGSWGKGSRVHNGAARDPSLAHGNLQGPYLSWISATSGGCSGGFWRLLVARGSSAPSHVSLMRTLAVTLPTNSLCLSACLRVCAPVAHEHGSRMQRLLGPVSRWHQVGSKT